MSEAMDAPIDADEPELEVFTVTGWWTVVCQAETEIEATSAEDAIARVQLRYDEDGGTWLGDNKMIWDACSDTNLEVWEGGDVGGNLLAELPGVEERNNGEIIGALIALIRAYEANNRPAGMPNPTGRDHHSEAAREVLGRCGFIELTADAA